MKKMIKKLLIIAIIIITTLLTFGNTKSQAYNTKYVEQWVGYYKDGNIRDSFYKWMQEKDGNGQLWQMYVEIEQKIKHWNDFKKYINDVDAINGEKVFQKAEEAEGGASAQEIFNQKVKAAFIIKGYESTLNNIVEKDKTSLTDEQIKTINKRINNNENPYLVYKEYGCGKYKDWYDYVTDRYEKISKLEEMNNSGLSDITQDVDYWKPGQSGDNTKINNIANIVLSLIRTIGIFVALGSLMVLGIKYMLGSLEEKAHYKQTMIPWIIGAIMVFAVTSLPKLIYDLAQNI